MRTTPHPAPTPPRRCARRCARPAALGAAGTAASGLACALLAQQAWATTTAALAAPHPTRPEEAVVIVALALAGALSAALTVLFALASSALAPGPLGARARSLADRLAPALTPRVSSVLITMSLTGLPANAAGPDLSGPAPAPRAATCPAAAPDEGPPEPTLDPAPASDCAPEPGWRPTPQAPQAITGSEQIGLLGSCPGSADRDQVVVHAGDSLWRIASRHLGPEATASQVAAEWPRWYAANREVIGDDPHLLLPGQVLTAPARTTAPTDPEG